MNEKPAPIMMCGQRETGNYGEHRKIASPEETGGSFQAVKF